MDPKLNRELRPLGFGARQFAEQKRFRLGAGFRPPLLRLMYIIHHRYDCLPHRKSAPQFDGFPNWRLLSDVTEDSGCLHDLLVHRSTVHSSHSHYLKQPFCKYITYASAGGRSRWGNSRWRRRCGQRRGSQWANGSLGCSCRTRSLHHMDSNFNSISIHWIDMSIWFQLHLQSLFWHGDN